MTSGFSVPSSSRKRRVERHRVARAELEDVADLDRGLEAQRAAAVEARVALLRLAEVGEARLEVAAVLDAAQVPAGAVRAGDELPFAQRLVGDDLAVEADRAERAGVGAERGADLVLGRRRARRRSSAAASFAGSSRSSPRTSASTTVPSSFTCGIAFDVAAASMPRNSASASIVVTPGRLDLLGRVEPRRELRRARHGVRDLEVGREVAVLAGDERVLARARRREEVDRLAAAHHPRLGLHGVVVDPAALEDPVVGAPRARGSSSRARPRRGRTSTSPS